MLASYPFTGGELKHGRKSFPILLMRLFFFSELMANDEQAALSIRLGSDMNWQFGMAIYGEYRGCCFCPFRSCFGHFSVTETTLISLIPQAYKIFVRCYGYFGNRGLGVVRCSGNSLVIHRFRTSPRPFATFRRIPGSFGIKSLLSEWMNRRSFFAWKLMILI